MNRAGVRRGRADDGFTLVELVLAILIIGVITVPLSNAVIAYLHNADATTARLLESHDAQIASAYWAQDVASIGIRNTTSPYALNQSVWTGVSSGLYSWNRDRDARLGRVQRHWHRDDRPGRLRAADGLRPGPTASAPLQRHDHGCQ